MVRLIFYVVVVLPLLLLSAHAAAMRSEALRGSQTTRLFRLDDSRTQYPLMAFFLVMWVFGFIFLLRS